ncbi:radical SAM protein [Thermodesulfobacteriota bacterium]
MSLKINEIFYSIQGESTFAGHPCTFVRLTGCNLRCSYCDTRYAYEEGDEMEISEVLSRVQQYQCPLVEITGGEPLIQKETPRLINQLLDLGHKVLLETNGSQDIDLVDQRCIKIVDFKCPSSGESKSSKLDNIAKISEHDEIKFVIGTREDYDYARRIIETLQIDPFRANQILLSAVFGQLEPSKLAQWILDDHLDVRMQLQMHKFIWNPNQRGV